jgi:hypothetical protein
MGVFVLDSEAGAIVAVAFVEVRDVDEVEFMLAADGDELTPTPAGMLNLNTLGCKR